MLAKAKRFLPDLHTENGKQWMGFRPSLPDTLPVIGRATKCNDIFYAFGHGHLGLTQSTPTARIMADIIAARTPQIDLNAFRPDRF
jgi:D-amino-acid dehydrogenase